MPIGYGVGLRIKRSSVRIRPWPLRWVLGQGSLLPLSQGEAFTLASISYLAILVKYILAKKKKKKKKKADRELNVLVWCDFVCHMHCWSVSVFLTVLCLMCFACLFCVCVSRGDQVSEGKLCLVLCMYRHFFGNDVSGTIFSGKSVFFWSFWTENYCPLSRRPRGSTGDY